MLPHVPGHSLTWPNTHQGNGVQFYTQQGSFEHDVALYKHARLREVLQTPIQAPSNAEGLLQGPGRFVYPSFVITEYGVAPLRRRRAECAMSDMVHVQCMCMCSYICIVADVAATST